MANKEELNKTIERLKNHPDLLDSIKEFLDIAEGVKGIEKADDAEFALIPEVRGFGKKILKDWAEHQSSEKEHCAKEEKLKLHIKKN